MGGRVSNEEARGSLPLGPKGSGRGVRPGLRQAPSPHAGVTCGDEQLWP